jgi:hypothetical protein
MNFAHADVIRIYTGSDGEATKALYGQLEALGPAGVVALNLFRACKSSSRAKQYRGGIRGRGSYRSMAYDRKGWAIENLCKTLMASAADLGIRWGWGIDEVLRSKGDPHHHVLYVDAPTVQVSFHSGHRGDGPDYPAQWDGVRDQAGGRICAWIGRLLAAEPA